MVTFHFPLPEPSVFPRGAIQRMKYAIFGDIHANLEAFQAVLEDAVQQGCTDRVCVGDIVGYGANPR